MNKKSINKAKVLFLGIFHFRDAPGHLVNDETPNMLTEKKQLEIMEVVRKIERFKPTKIAVEIDVEKFKELNSEYKEYCKSNILYDPSEVRQIGFRLAKILGHKLIYPINFRESLPYEEAMEYAKKNEEKYKEYIERFFKYIGKCQEDFNNLVKTSSVIEVLRDINNTQNIKIDHSLGYLEFCKIGAGQKYEGANFLSAWYDRNIKIFANLQNITKPEDKVLVIYGNGHAPILKRLIEDIESMELVDTLEYLK